MDTDSGSRRRRGCRAGTVRSCWRWVRGGWASNVAFDPARLSHAYIAAGPVLATNDGGRTWRTLLRRGRADDFAVDPEAPATIYAATTTGLYKSTDRGSKWRRLWRSGPLAGLSDVAVDPSQPSRVLAARDRTGVFVSEDGGRHWSRLDDGLATSRVFGFVIAPEASTAVYLNTGLGVFVLSRS